MELNRFMAIFTMGWVSAIAILGVYVSLHSTLETVLTVILVGAMMWYNTGIYKGN